MIYKIKQGFNFLFKKYNSENNKIVKTFLSDEEYKIFINMSEYDKFHSFNLFKACKKNNVLCNNILYLKATLLHDCGKENASLFRRIKKVITNDKLLNLHQEIGYEKLKNINIEVATIVKNHHNKPNDKFMKEFQNLDNKN